MPDVLSLVFQSSLVIEGILFATFGIFFSVYALFFSIVDPENPKRSQVAPVVNVLRQVCRVIALLIVLNAAIAIYSLVRSNLVSFKLDYSGFENIVLSTGFAVTIVTIAIISWIWAFKYMPK